MDTNGLAPLRVAVVEDQPLYRGLLTATLRSEAGFSVVASVGSVAEARRLIRPDEVDVLLLDIELPDGNGFGLGASLRASDPRLGVVLLSSHDVMELLLGLPPERRGGWSYLSKTSATSPAMLLRALRASAAGGGILDPVLVERMIPRAESPLAALSPRQFHALRLLSGGLSNAAIADEMGISAHSVDNLLNSVYAVLSVREDGSANARVTAALLMIEHSTSDRTRPTIG